MSFDRAVVFVLEQEGGEVNDPNDPGGWTKYGISQRAYPDVDIPGLMIEEAKAIYRRDYWDKLPQLPNPVKLLAFDFGVNAGIGRAVKSLQAAIGVKVDGYWGPMSESKLDSFPAREVLIKYSAERARHYALLDDLDDLYARGWMLRTFRAYNEALALV
jgi:lysozyme family protein